MDEENGFHCQCPEGFKPPYCYSQVDECGSSPCVHGSCRDDINGYELLTVYLTSYSHGYVLSMRKFVLRVRFAVLIHVSVHRH